MQPAKTQLFWNCFHGGRGLVISKTFGQIPSQLRLSNKRPVKGVKAGQYFQTEGIWGGGGYILNSDLEMYLSKLKSASVQIAKHICPMPPMNVRCPIGWPAVLWAEEELRHK